MTIILPRLAAGEISAMYLERIAVLRSGSNNYFTPVQTYSGASIEPCPIPTIHDISRSVIILALRSLCIVDDNYGNLHPVTNRPAKSVGKLLLAVCTILPTRKIQELNIIHFFRPITSERV